MKKFGKNEFDLKNFKGGPFDPEMTLKFVPITFKNILMPDSDF